MLRRAKCQHAGGIAKNKVNSRHEVKCSRVPSMEREEDVVQLSRLSAAALLRVSNAVLAGIEERFEAETQS